MQIVEFKRRFLLATIIIIFTSIFASPVRAETSVLRSAYRDYRDIPGVTADDIAAIEKLKEKRGSFKYGAGGSTETFLAGDGSIGGFSRYFCDWLSELFGIPFVPSIYRLTNLSSEVAIGNVDFTCEFATTRELRSSMFSTDTVVKRTITRFRLLDAEPISSISMRRPLKYGFVQWYQTARIVYLNVSEPFETFFYSRREDAIEALQSGEIDAFVMDARGEAAFVELDNVKQETFFPLVYFNGAFATANEELAPIVNVVQKFLETNGAEDFLSSMYDRGERDFRSNSFIAMLSDEEKRYIEEHVSNNIPIPFAAEYKNYPVSFYNQRERELQGIAIDILREVSALSGLTFKPTDPDTQAWADLQELFDSGEAALITELIYTRNRRERYLWPDTPYDVQQFALLSRLDTPGYALDRIGDLRVGAVRGSAFEEVFREFFPDHKRLSLYSGNEEAFDALSSGEIDLFMGSVNRLLYVTNYLERTNFKLNVTFDRSCDSSFGFGVNQAILCSIVSKAQRTIDINAIARNWKQRAFDYRRTLLEEQIPYHMAFASCMFIAVAASLYLFMINERIRKGLSNTVTTRTMQLQLQSVAAQNASHAKSEFLARMSHEMRTPLNAITGMANIAENTDDRAKSDDSADKIEKASAQLRAIIDDILKLSSIESYSHDITQSNFRVKTMLDNVVGLSETHAREKFQTIVLKIANNVPDVVTGDSTHIGQALRNLLSNAIKFSPQGEDILLDVSTQNASWLPDGYVGLCFDVTDHGIGISEEEQRHLFQAFEQIEDYKDRSHGGVGVGLAISKKLVESMGGKVLLESTAGVGSKFTMIIPVPLK